MMTQAEIKATVKKTLDRLCRVATRSQSICDPDHCFNTWAEACDACDNHAKTASEIARDLSVKALPC